MVAATRSPIPITSVTITLSVQIVERTDLIFVHSEARALPRLVRRTGIGEVYGPTPAYGCDGGPDGIC
ncbi:hypothetical protein GCM10009548_33480 [Streptomyces malaysiensis subsp. malaysiensis]